MIFIFVIVCKFIKKDRGSSGANQILAWAMASLTPALDVLSDTNKSTYEYLEVGLGDMEKNRISNLLLRRRSTASSLVFLMLKCR